MPIAIYQNFEGWKKGKRLESASDAAQCRYMPYVEHCIAFSEKVGVFENGIKRGKEGLQMQSLHAARHPSRPFGEQDIAAAW